MNPHGDDLQKLWFAQADASGVKGEDMLQAAMDRSRTMSRRIGFRNWTERSAAAIGAAFFAVFAFRAPNALAAAGAWILVASSIWIAYYLTRFGQWRDADPGADLATYRRTMIENYDRQIRLLRSVKYWYLLPPYIGLIVLTVGNMQARTSAMFGWTYLAMTTIVFGGVWALNQVVGVRRLRRQKQELIELCRTDEE